MLIKTIHHSALPGLLNDDHPQYHTDARGDARYVNLGGDTMTGNLKLPTLTITDPTQNYTFQKTDAVANALALVPAGTGQQARLQLMNFDGDRSQSVVFDVYGLGSPDAGFGSTERVSLGWSAVAGSYVLVTGSSGGSGVQKKLILSADASLTQLILETGGNISVQNTLTATNFIASSTVTAANINTVVLQVGDEDSSDPAVLTFITSDGTATIQWDDSSQFQFNDALSVTGNIDATGNLTVNGTGLFGVSDQFNILTDKSALGEAPIGTWVGQKTAGAGDALTIMTSTDVTTPGVKLVLAYLHGASPFIRSALEVANVATAPGELLLMKSGGNVVLGENLVLPKASGVGIKIDTASPTFGFADLLGDQFSKNTGGTKPTLTAYNGAVDAWQFGNGDEAFLTYHIPHDYVPGSDIHLHIHWSQNATGATGGTVDFTYTAIYAKGHNQASGSVFTTTPKTATFSSINIDDGGSGLNQYQQHFTEVTISAATATAALFDRDDFEPDGVIELTLEMTTTNLTGTPSLPFIHYVDIHYQTTSVIGTKSRTPDFYT